MAKRALIMVKLDAPPAKEAAWNAWYNGKHIPDRMAIEGFLAARRFTRIEGTPKGFAIPGEPRYLSLYELADTGAVKGKPYRELRDKEAKMPAGTFEAVTLDLPKFARGVYDQIFPDKDDYTPPPTRFVFVVGHEVPRNRHQEFNAWYNTEHLPALLTVPGIVAGRRFKLSQDTPVMLLKGGSMPTYLTIYDVETPDAIESEKFWQVSVSPWSTWVRSWFTRKMCMLYQQIYPGK